MSLAIEGGNQASFPEAARLPNVENSKVRSLHTIPRHLTGKLLSRFERHCTPIEMSGDREKSPLLFFGGLGATHFPHEKYAYNLHEALGTTILINPIDNTNGNLDKLKNISPKDWVRQVGDQVAKVGNHLEKPTGIGYSTSGLAILIYESLHPGTFKSIVLISPPLCLSNKRNEFYLSLASVLKFTTDKIPFARFKITDKFYVDYKSPDAGPMTLDERASPGLIDLPVNAGIALRQAQLLAKKALSKIHCDVFAARGENDPVVSAESLTYLDRYLPKTTSKQIIEIPDSGHGPQMGRHKAFFYKILLDYLTPRVSASLTN